jgi:hypothetical protein
MPVNGSRHMHQAPDILREIDRKSHQFDTGGKREDLAGATDY